MAERRHGHTGAAAAAAGRRLLGRQQRRKRVGQARKLLDGGRCAAAAGAGVATGASANRLLRRRPREPVDLVRRPSFGSDVVRPGLSATLSASRTPGRALRSTRRSPGAGDNAGTDGGSAGSGDSARLTSPPASRQQLLDPADDELRLERLRQHAVAADGRGPRLVDRLERAGQQQRPECARAAACS